MYLRTPFYGTPRATAELQRMGYEVNHKHVRRLRRELGLRTVYPRPKFNTSEAHPEHEKFPYLLRDVAIARPNQVWATDITYTAVGGGRAFVIAIMDLYSRKVLAYNVVNTMDAEHCIDTLTMALRRYGRPEIFNSDQGSQFTSREFIKVLKDNGIGISMDGKGAWRDNVFVERLWRTIKYEEVYRRAYSSVSEARASLARYIDGFYNARRPHSSLDRKTPDEAYFNALSSIPMAA